MSLPTEHTIESMGRVRLGTGAVKGQGMRYGTAVRCSCGWRRQVNVAPSRGGKRMASDAWEAHEREVSP